MLRNLAGACIALTLAVAAPAGAATFHAAPGGIESGSCPESAPCSLQRALDQSGGTDHVVLAPGTYTPTSIVTDGAFASIGGRPGAPRPKIVGTADPYTTVMAVSAPGRLRHVAIETAASSATALFTGAGATVEDVLVTATGYSATALFVTGGLVRDTVVRTTGNETRAFYTQGRVRARNVTAVASGENSDAVTAAGNSSQTTDPWGGVICNEPQSASELALRNVIARGSRTDLMAHNGPCGASNRDAGVIRVDHSNYRPDRVQQAGPGSAVVDVGDNQSADPRFADAALRPAADSPVIDAGTADPDLGATDPDGEARTQGAAPDIGAYEFTPPVQPGPGPGSGSTDQTGPPQIDGIPPDRVGPSLGLRLKRLIRRRALLRRGLRVRATCSEACVITLKLKTTRGRTVGRATTRLTAAGTKRKTVKVRKSSRRRVRRAKRLKLVITAVDPAGNRTRRTRKLKLR